MHEFTNIEKHFPKEKIKFDWIIENFSMCVQLSEEPICSPEFFIDIFGTKLCLKLYPRGYENNDNYMSLNVVCLNSDYSNVYLDKYFMLQVLIPPSTGAMFTSAFQAGYIDLKKKVCFKCPKLVKRQLKPVDSLEIGVTIWPVTNRNTFTTNSPCNDDDLKSLSSDMEKGLYDKDYYDFILKGLGGKIFNVHKAILFTRYPYLASKLEMAQEQAEKFDVDSKTLQVLLKYLYSGTVDLADIPQGIFKILDDHNLLHLQNILLPIPKIVEATTRVCIRRGSFVWEIPSFSDLPSDTVLSNVFSCDELLNWTKIRLKFYFSQNEKNEQCVSISVQRIHTEQRIRIKLKIVIEGSTLYDNDFFHTFENETEFEAPNLLKKSSLTKKVKSVLLKDVLCIKFDVVISNGTFMSGTNFARLPIVCSKRSNQTSVNLLALQQDLLRLYIYPVFSDINICVGSEVMQVHKIVLSLRSPVFRKMLERETLEKIIGWIVITDFEPIVVRSMLIYMYCGSIFIEKMNYDFAVKLHAISDKYEVLELKQKCRKYLREIICVTNFANILAVADTHSDAELKKDVYSYMCGNVEQVLNSKAWMKVKEERFDLAIEMMKIYMGFEDDNLTDAALKLCVL